MALYPMKQASRGDFFLYNGVVHRVRERNSEGIVVLRWTNGRSRKAVEYTYFWEEVKMSAYVQHLNFTLTGHLKYRVL